MILQGGGRVFLWVDCPAILHYFFVIIRYWREVRRANYGKARW